MVQADPDAMCLLTSDCQLNDMARFCTDQGHFSVVGVDPTFNLGEFSVTVKTYKHLQLTERQTKKPPVLLSPMIVHQKRIKIVPFSCIRYRWTLNSLVAFGTDGGKALGDAFHAQFPTAKHLLCFIHVKSRIKIKLRDLGISTDIAKGILRYF